MNILKKFFLSFLGSMAAIWFTFLLLLVLIVAGVAVSVASLGTGVKSIATSEIKKGSVLCLDLKGPISERAGESDFTDMLINNLENAGGINLNETVDAIYRAAHDQRIAGIFIEGNGAYGGVASLQDIREALDYFKAQPGKWVMAYSDNYAQSDYYISTSANEIWLNPIGAVDLHGLSGTTLFYTGLLDKLGVKMQILRVGTFKSAVEPYFLTQMSPASRLQQESYMGALWSTLREDMAKSLNVTPETVNRWADDFTFTMSADSLKAKGIVNNLGYRHDAETRVAELAKKDKFKDVDRVTISEYYAGIESGDYSYLPDVKSPKKSDKTIAVLYAVGDIVDSGTDGGIIGKDMVEEINKIADDSDNLAGLILRVNSPGGSAFASEQIWEALQQFKKNTELPVYVSMGDVAASGGYYISCGADVIYAQPTTITGSIGIFGMIPEIKGLLNNHLGVNASTVNTNRNGNFPSIFEPMTDEQQTKMQAYIERGYDLFTRRCAEGRHTSQDSIKAIAEGRVWAGSQALENGLVDRMGSLRSAICGMASDLGLKAYHIRTYPETSSKWWETFMSMNQFDMDTRITDVKALKYLKALTEAPTVNCRMETVIIK